MHNRPFYFQDSSVLVRLQRGWSWLSASSKVAGDSEEFCCWTGSPPCNSSVWPPPPPLDAPVALVALNNATVPHVMFASWLWPPAVFTVTVNTAGSRKWSIVTLSRRSSVCGHRTPPGCSPAVHRLCGQDVWRHLKCFTAFGWLWTCWDVQSHSFMSEPFSHIWLQLSCKVTFELEFSSWIWRNNFLDGRKFYS